MRLISPLLVISLFVLVACGRLSAPADVKKYNLNSGTRSVGVIQVYEGDNLYRLSKIYNLPIRDIIDENNLKSPFILNVGDRLKIPSPRTHKVKSGESYAYIARLYDLSVTELVKQNNAKAPYRLYEGDEVYLSRSKVKTVSPTNKKTIIPKKKMASVRQKVNIPNPPKRANSGKGFSWPVRGRVLSSYGSKEGGLFNDGINIGAPRGSVVRSAENGVVVYSGNELKGFGNLVLIKHDGGYVTAYAHLEKSLVKKGTILSKGEGLGTIGSTGSVDTPQLHFEVRKNGKAINPKNYL